MTSRGGICLRTVAAPLAALPVMAPLKPPQAAGVPAASRSSCARQNLIQRYAAKTQHNSGVPELAVQFRIQARLTRTRPMSALGHKRTLRHLRSMSALPPKADMDQNGRDVRFVP